MEDQVSNQVLGQPSAYSSSGKWYHFSKTVYIGLSIMAILSLGITAVLVFSPFNSGTTNTRSKAAENTQNPLDKNTTSIENQKIGFNSSQLTPTVIMTPTEIPTPTPFVAVAWSVYNNSKYKYKITYPPTYKMTDLGQLEPLVPSYVSFNPTVASAASTLSITVSVSLRSYDEVISTKAANRASIRINGMTGIKTEEKNSNGDISYHVVLKGRSYVYILVGKKAYKTYFDLMYPTFSQI